MKRAATAVLFFVLLATFVHAGTIITVGPGGVDAGYDCNTIAEGINEAVNGDTVLVADGIYTGTGNKNLDFGVGPKAITVQSENGPENCIIDCQSSGRGFIFQNSETTSSIIDGLTIKNGKITGNPAKGGGIYCSGASPAIKNCIITNNKALGNNSSSNPGGNAYGGGIYGNATISNCVIKANLAKGGSSDFGRGISFGGGIYGDVTITNCIIANNQAVDGGGTAPLPVSKGGGIATSVSTITNCTVTANLTKQGIADGISAGGATTITNCIIWGNGDDLNGASATYSCIEDGDAGTGNISSDPCFVSGPAGDYYLSQIAAGQAGDSLCLNAGSDTAANLGLDTLTTRTDQIYDTGTVDMGYHYSYYYLLPTGEQCDIDGDGDVDMVDLSIMGNQWKLTPGVPSADIAPVGGDGMVDINDLALLTGYWLFLYPDPPVAWWKFDQGTGAGANDSAGSNDGTLVGEPNWVSPGKLGTHALDFNGVEDYVEIPDANSLTPSDQITIAYWIYKRSGQNAGIFKSANCPGESNSPGDSRAYIFYISDSTSRVVFRIFSSADNYDTAISNNVISPNQWHHIAATFDQGYTSIYIDGQLDSVSIMSVNSIMNDAQPLIIGGYWNYCGTDSFVNCLDGKIDDVRIYDVALTDEEIEEIYKDDEVRSNKANNPNPTDLETNVSVTADLSWTAAAAAENYDVYLGTTFDDVNDANTADAGIYRGNVDVNSFDPCTLDVDTTYYWRIDSNNKAGTTTGSLWNFTTLTVPGQVTNPGPANLATIVDVTADISWTAVAAAENYDVYLGTTFDDVNDANTADAGIYRDNVDVNSFDPGTLDANTTYYWRIDPNNEVGTTTGSLWSFTTWENYFDPYLAGKWKFDEGTGTNANDSAGTNDGTLVGEPNWVAGKIGTHALDFNSVVDYVALPNTVKNSLATNYTVSAWINTNTISSTHSIATYRQFDSQGILFQLEQYDADVRFIVRDNSSDIAIAISSGAITTDGWYHVAGVRAGNTVHVYVNGIKGTSDSATFVTISSNNFKIGALQTGDPGTPQAYFDGAIDDVRIYDMVLSDEEIQMLYLAGL